MKVLIWLVEGTWEGCVAAARALLPADAEVTLVYVADAEVPEAADGAMAGLLGRGRPGRDPGRRIAALSQTAAAQLQEAGSAKFLDGVFEGMSTAFNASKAGGQQATVQYEITAPDGTHPYTMRIADGRCEVERGAAESPRVTIRAALPDFLRLITGKANGVQLFMTGKLKVSGDLFFAQTFQGWFDRPS